MNDLEKLFHNVTRIRRWIKSAPDPTTFEDDDQFMRYTVQLMNRALFLLRVGSSLAPNEQTALRGFTRRRAIVVGHIVRMTKLYEGSLALITKRHLETAGIFSRLIYETAVRIEYLMRAKNASFRSYVLTSYRSEKEILADMKEKAAKRRLMQIERRIKRKIQSRLKEDRISSKQLMNNRNWNLDGKSFRGILKDVGREPEYSYGFGSSSHFVHGDWADLSVYHLTKKGRYYKPRLEFADPDPRLACSLTTVCLGTLYKFIAWNKSDPDNYLRPIILELLELNRCIDNAHEETMGP